MEDVNISDIPRKFTSQLGFSSKRIVAYIYARNTIYMGQIYTHTRTGETYYTIESTNNRNTRTKNTKH